MKESKVEFIVKIAHKENLTQMTSPMYSTTYFEKYFIVVQLQLSAFNPHPSSQPQPNPLPSLACTLPLGFVHVSFIVIPENPSPYYPLTPPLWLLLDFS